MSLLSIPTLPTACVVMDTLVDQDESLLTNGTLVALLAFTL